MATEETSASAERRHRQPETRTAGLVKRGRRIGETRYCRGIEHVGVAGGNEQSRNSIMEALANKERQSRNVGGEDKLWGTTGLKEPICGT